MGEILIRRYTEGDVPSMMTIWNQVIEDGVAFPQLDMLTEDHASAFFAQQTYCAVAERQEDHTVVGMYILHPNNVGRCDHLGNASYAVERSCRGEHIGEKLVCDCIQQAGSHGFRILQFNAVVASNIHARHLYERIGFHPLGTVPGGFLMPDGHYEDICLYYIETPWQRR
jgi:L-amino acid N-acyltransferase YncA